MMANRWPRRDVSQFDMETRMQKPSLIGCFSRDRHGEYHYDASEKRYLNETKHPKIDLNLSDESNYVEFDDTREMKPRIVNWLTKYKCELWSETSERLKYEVVMDGRTLKEIMMAPYTRRNFVNSFHWIYKYNDTYYVQSPAHRQQSAEEKRKYGYIGHKFASSMTSGNADDHIINANKTFYQVLKTRINEHLIIYSSNIDCVTTPKDSDFEGVEIAATKESFKSYKFGRYKLLDLWTKCLISGTSEIICGSYDENLFIESKNINKFRIDEILEMVKTIIPNEQKSWKHNVCVSFADHFFTFMKDQVNEEKKFYKIEFTPKDELRCSEQSDPDLSDEERRKFEIAIKLSILENF